MEGCGSQPKDRNRSGEKGRHNQLHSVFWCPWEIALPAELHFGCKVPQVFARVVFLSTFRLHVQKMA